MATFAVVFKVLEQRISPLSAVATDRVGRLPSANGAIVLDTAVVVLRASESHKRIERDVRCRHFNVFGQRAIQVVRHKGSQKHRRLVIVRNDTYGARERSDRIERCI
jgi:hypothetical protein